MIPEIYALSMGKKTHSRRYAMRPIINVSEEDRATDTGNMHKNLVTIALVVPEILAERQTDRPTDTHTHHNTSQPLPREK